MLPEFTKVAVLENGIEAQLLDSILTERDIPHRIQSYYDTAYDGLFQAQKGWGYVAAPAEAHAEIKTVLNDLRRDSYANHTSHPH